MYLKIARLLLIAASLLPISVGSYYYLHFALSSSFGYIEHIAFTNLVYSGVALFTLSFFGLKRDPKPWVLFLIFFNLYWTIGNDTYATVRFFASTNDILPFPFPVIPLVLGTIAAILITIELKNE